MMCVCVIYVNLCVIYFFMCVCGGGSITWNVCSLYFHDLIHVRFDLLKCMVVSSVRLTPGNDKEHLESMSP